MNQQRLTVAAAATRLNLSEAAIRNRIQRGTLTAERDNGRLFVLLPADEPATQPDEPQGQNDIPSDEPAPCVMCEALRALLDQVSGERDNLRDQVQHLTRLVDQQQQLTLATTRALPDPDQARRRSWWPWSNRKGEQ